MPLTTQTSFARELRKVGGYMYVREFARLFIGPPNCFSWALFVIYVLLLPDFSASDLQILKPPRCSKIDMPMRTICINNDCERRVVV